MARKRRRVEFPAPPAWRFGPLVLGPGLALALVLALFLLRAPRLQAPGRRLPERVAAADAKPMVLPPGEIGLVPEPAWLVRRGAEIPLTAEQTRRAGELARAWSEETAATRAELAQASDELARYLGARRAEGRFDQADAMRHSAAVAELSADLARRRHDDWERIWVTLDEAQQRRVKELRSTSPLEMR